MRKVIFLLIILIVIMTMPSISMANAEDVSVKQVTFEYDGCLKCLELVNVPDDIDEDELVWTITKYPDDVLTATGSSVEIGTDVVGGNYSVVIGSNDKTLSGEFEIYQREMTIKPVDVYQEFSGQTLTPSNYTLVSGSLVLDHTMMISYDGSINKVGKTVSSIKSMSIFDNTGTSVIDNYNITTQTGLLVLTEPFIVTLDPEPDGKLGGVGTAYPSVLRSNSGIVQDNGTTNISGADDSSVKKVTNISENETPLSLNPSIPDETKVPLADKPHNSLLVAFLVTGLMLIAITAIFLILRKKVA